jgi:RES domain
MNCCPECFGDRGLRKNIFPLRSTATGRCEYCGTENVAVLPATQLTEYFELLISAYQINAGGKRLVQVCREDWSMFENPRMDDAQAENLLIEIFGDREIVAQTYSPAHDAEAVRLNEWEKLREELMYHNRFFPDANIDLKRLESLLSPLTVGVGEVPNTWYRARIQVGDTPFPIGQMGAPPNRTASHGRANPAGIPYLYLASTQTTAISEIRPQTGEMACVADFTTRVDLKLVDLRNPRKMVSPFLLEDAADIERMRSDLPFLERLGDELTRPVLPQAAATDYTPSQYLCEFIKKCGYEGVIYRSSVGEGINLALFAPALAESRTVTRYRVNRVSVNVEAVEP